VVTPTRVVPGTGVRARPAAPRASAPPGHPHNPAAAVRQQAGLITDQVPKAIAKTVSETIGRPTIPLLLLVIVVGFLLLQNQIDRSDPKLASAPVGAEPELEFGPVYGSAPRLPQDGGAPA
jgi:hypothetical protein